MKNDAGKLVVFKHNNYGIRKLEIGVILPKTQNTIRALNIFHGMSDIDASFDSTYVDSTYEICYESYGAKSRAGLYIWPKEEIEFLLK
jgi:hypothetical protein